MVYTKNEWYDSPSTLSPISADRLNNLETQYDQAVEYTNQQLANASSGGGIDPAVHGVPTDGVTNAGPAMNALIASLSPGAVIAPQPGQVFNVGTSIVVSKGITIRGGTYLHQPTVTTFSVTANNVTFEGITVIGPDLTSSTPTASRMIYAGGSSSTLIDNLAIRRSSFTNCHHTVINMAWCSNFLIEGNSIQNAQYAGIMLISPKVGTVRENTVRNLVQGGTLINSYGIAASDSANVESARAEDVLIVNNYVDGVPKWEGIDTHGGKNIKIIGNTIRNCLNPVAVLVGNPARALSPIDCVVSDNFIERGSAPDTKYAIAFVGVSDSNRCSGLIGSNVIRGYSRDFTFNFIDQARFTVLPQSFSGSTTYGPDPAPYRMWIIESDITVRAGNTDGVNRAYTFPAGRFTIPPRVFVSPVTNIIPDAVGFAYSVTETGVNIGLRVAGGGTSSSDRVVRVAVLCIQPASYTSNIPGS